ncbi:MAG: hypothetical protein WB662_04110 [Methyloceanibacter sp.]
MMPTYEVGDYVKAEFKDERALESEWMWVRVDSCNEMNRLVFGRLDSVPVLDYGEKLNPGSEVVISFENIREHRKPSEIEKG